MVLKVTWVFTLNMAWFVKCHEDENDYSGVSDHNIMHRIYIVHSEYLKAV